MTDLHPARMTSVTMIVKTWEVGVRRAIRVVIVDGLLFDGRWLRALLAIVDQFTNQGGMQGQQRPDRIAW